ncbi:PfaB family protein [Vibrio tapetis subsp. quintayensis]|nr:PfaB family protein [Vibrio tapetis]MDN3682228.1 PfaB family protein [Vibrio tapetis subsp. quintayensis]
MMDSTNKAMPLRIALLANSTISDDGNVKCITVADDFSHSLKTAIQAIEQGQTVQLIAQTPAQGHLILMAGLKAAQSHLHPDAYLSGMSESTEQALSQSRRRHSDVSCQQEHDNINAQQQFDAFLLMVEAIAGRTYSSENHYWFTEPNQARVASLTFTGTQAINSQTTSMILTQATGLKNARSILSASRLMFVVSAQDKSSLATKLDQLNQQLNQCSSEHDLLCLMRSNLAAYQLESTANVKKPTAVLQAASKQALAQEIQAMSQALDKAFTDNSHFKTPAGSCFSAAPTSQGAVAFVYPGVGTVYPRMLDEMHHYFPELYARLEREGNLKQMLQAEKTYPTSADSKAEMSLGEMAIAGVGTSYLFTRLLCDEFKVTPNYALGYSKGEASMWASLGIWQNPHALIEQTKTSPIFTSAISGELTAVRQEWQLKQDEVIKWNSFVVRCDKQEIQALLPAYPRAYLAIIQGDTCVLAGCEESCRALLKALGKRGIAANRVTAMHTTPALTQHSQVTEFYTQPLCDTLPTNIGFISAACLINQEQSLLVNPDSQSIATSIADTFCSTLDFTALIRAAREQGAKLFVEVGADRQTATLIDKINRTDSATDCSSIVTNAKGGEDIVHLIKCLGQLITHQIPLSVAPLIERLDQRIALAADTTNLKQGEPV